MLKKIILISLLVAVVGSQGVWADLFLYDLAFNVNGTVAEYMYDSWFSMDENVDNAATIVSSIEGYSSSTLDYETGLGTVTFRYDAPGEYSVASFFDIEMSENINTFSNETAEVIESPEAGLSWEVDEPGFGSPQTYDEEGNPDLYYTGDIYDNLIDDSFDNSIFTTTSFYSDFKQEPDLIDDVSVGLGWNFTLAADESAEVTFSVIDPSPSLASGFYILHTDPESNESVAYTASLTITDGDDPVGVPEPATGSLIALGLFIVGLVGVRRKR